MSMKILFGAGCAALFMCQAIGSASALSAKECSTKYQAEKEAGTLSGQSWPAFRKAQCAGASPTAPAAPSANPLRADSAPKSDVAVFPKAVDPEFASLKPAQARRKTCAKQFQANKATKANGGLRWLETGGGYYSLCNSRLKGV